MIGKDGPIRRTIRKRMSGGIFGQLENDWDPSYGNVQRDNIIEMKYQSTDETLIIKTKIEDENTKTEKIKNVLSLKSAGFAIQITEIDNFGLVTLKPVDTYDRFALRWDEKEERNIEVEFWDYTIDH